MNAPFLSLWFVVLTLITTSEVAIADATPDGKALYATCAICHGVQGEGGMGAALNNQTVDAIVAKLKGYQNGQIYGPTTSVMAPMAMGLSEADMIAIADYVVTLGK